MPGDISRPYKGPKDGSVPSWMEEDNEKCWRCRGDGYFYRLPDGLNPFYMGAIRAAEASYRVECYTCGGTGKLTLTTPQ